MSLRAGLAVVVLVCQAAFGGVAARFDPASPGVGPFPADSLAVADSSQKTGLRINMPLPDCTAEPSTCAELALVNQMDGFELQPRVRVRFSGPIDPDTLRAGIYFGAYSGLGTAP